MTSEPSPRPWRVSASYADRYSTGHRDITDAKGELVAVRVSATDAALIVDAVNERDLIATRLEAFDKRLEEAVAIHDELCAERDRLRDIVRRLVDLFTPGTIHPSGTMERLLRDARAAIGGENQ